MDATDANRLPLARVREVLSTLPGRTICEAEITEDVHEPNGAYYQTLRLTFTEGEPFVLFSWDQERYASGMDTDDTYTKS